MSTTPLAAKAVAVVWKFGLGHLKETIRMPSGASVLHVHDQGGIPHLWAKGDPDAELESRVFMCIGTGQEFPADAAYLGSAHCDGFVWHVFEVLS